MLTLTSCTLIDDGEDPPTDDLSADFDVTEFVNIEDVLEESSLIIRDHEVLDQIAEETDMGFLLGELAEWSRGEPGTAVRADLTPGTFVARAFLRAKDQQDRHATSAATNKLGSDPYGGAYERTMGAVFRNWMPAESLEAMQRAEDLSGGPFRLLAVVNRMDRAADVDDRGTSRAAAHPRSLGEIHLVYGLVDESFETAKGKPFPMTFVLAYRLPQLEWRNGELSVVEDPEAQGVSHWDLVRTPRRWRFKLSFWARLWARLSEVPRNDPDFLRQMRQILRLSVRPENFLAMRNNTMLNVDEFELREWYMLQRTQVLIPRRPRREPFRCLSGSQELGELVKRYWDGENGDLDVSTLHPDGPDADLFDDGKNGFTVFRDSRRLNDELSWSSCPESSTEMPFGMPGESSVFMTAQFGRVAGSGAVWQADGTTEKQRHAFAIRTCSGCHSQEGATRGFHIFPRFADEDSRLSSYLEGGDDAKFSRAGETYRYDILGTRKEWLVEAFNREATMFSSLRRPELMP
jgi:hypothetical protein